MGIRFRKARGFTLIELIMVIVIIGVLAAVAIPKYMSLSAKAEQAVCNDRANQIDAALAIQYAVQAASPASDPAWLDHFNNFADIQSSWFASGAVPVCPLGQAYVVASGRTVRHTHNQ